MVEQLFGWTVVRSHNIYYDRSAVWVRVSLGIGVVFRMLDYWASCHGDFAAWPPLSNISITLKTIRDSMKQTLTLNDFQNTWETIQKIWIPVWKIQKPPKIVFVNICPPKRLKAVPNAHGRLDYAHYVNFWLKYVCENHVNRMTMCQSKNDNVSKRLRIVCRL